MFDQKEMKVQFKLEELEKLLVLRTKKDIYTQNDGVVMVSLKGPTIVKIYMVNLVLESKISGWERYVDEIVAYIKLEEILLSLK